jgi:hypothetical protein
MPRRVFRTLWCRFGRADVLRFSSGLVAWVVVAWGSPLGAQDHATPAALRFDPPTLHSIGVRWYIEGDDDGDTICRLRYRQAGQESWLEGQPLLRVNRETVDRDFEQYGANAGTYTVGNLLAGSLLFLAADTDYEIRLDLSDPDGGGATHTEKLRTRAEPSAPLPRRTLHLYPPDYVGQRLAPAHAHMQAAFDALRPGDLLLVHPGVHPGGVTLSVDGTQTAPIVIRGLGDGAVIVAPDDGAVNLGLDDRDHVFIEGLDLRGGRIGILARGARHLTVRRCRISEVKFGIFNDHEGSSHWYIADNILTGIDSHWTPRTQENAAETGINVFGRGHVVEYNRISRFWDCLAVADFGRPPGGVDGIDRHAVAIDFNNNDLSQARDDLLETDFASHNVRVFDNRLFNGHTGCSVQPLYGGPVYFVGNVVYGVVGSAFKLHNWPAGIYLFNNTSITSDMAFRSAPLWQNATWRNNLFLGGGSGYTMESGSPDPRTSLDYNGWSRGSDEPGSFIKFTDDGTLSGASQFRFADLGAFFAATGNAEHSIEVGLDAFAAAVYPLTGVTYGPETVDLQLVAGAAPLDAGVRLDNITRSFTGSAPDLGAYQRGVPRPHYGPRPVAAPTLVEAEVGGSTAAIVGLRQNRPNPFNAQTAIGFDLPAAGTVELGLYSLTGQRLARLAAGSYAAGVHRIVWAGRDDEGRLLASGVYLYRLRVGATVRTRKLVLLR